MVVDSSTLRSSAYLDTIVHELGHVLGLWHVHHGISEVHCDDQCLETHASLGKLATEQNIQTSMKRLTIGYTFNIIPIRITAFLIHKFTLKYRVILSYPLRTQLLRPLLFQFDITVFIYLFCRYLIRARRSVC